MREAQNINLNLGYSRKFFKRQVNYDDILIWIDELEYSDEIKEQLKKLAKNTPNNALPGFQQNIRKNVARINKKLLS